MICVMLFVLSGDGIVVNDIVEVICMLVGIKNIKVKIYGSYYSYNIVRVVFAVLEVVEFFEDVVRCMGLMIYRV